MRGVSTDTPIEYGVTPEGIAIFVNNDSTSTVGLGAEFRLQNNVCKDCMQQKMNIKKAKIQSRSSKM